MHETDVLIVGCGVAGCTAALDLAQKGVNVTVITNSQEARNSSSFFVQEGIAYTPDEEAVNSFKLDMRDVGGDLVNPRALDHLIDLGPKIVTELLMEELKVPFDTEPDGSLKLLQAKFHSQPRLLRASDHVGKAVIDSMLRKIATLPNVTLLPDRSAVDLITLAQHSTKRSDVYKKPACVGAYILNHDSGEIETWLAKETIIATGGTGELYLHSTNSASSRGDGIAMAHRAGARLMNLEYVQFYPTCLYIPNEGRRLSTEMIDSPGAQLLTQRGATFLSMPDESVRGPCFNGIARGIYQEMLGTGSDHVWLDLRNCDRVRLHEDYPNILDYCATHGFDADRQPLPVVPAAHYHCGGIAVDRNGQSSISRLRAVGEVSCTGVHGTARLPSVGVLESLVWGRSCAEDVANNIAKFAYYFPPVADCKNGSESVDPALLHQDWNSLKQTMWNYVGPVRRQRRLRRASQLIRELLWENEQLRETARLTPELVGLRNGLETGQLIAEAACSNQRSLADYA